jgi:hypothetical protein
MMDEIDGVEEEDGFFVRRVGLLVVVFVIGDGGGEERDGLDDARIVDGGVGGEVSMVTAVGADVSMTDSVGADVSIIDSVGADVSISMGAGVRTASVGAAVAFWVGASVTTVETTGASETTGAEVTTSTGSESPIGLTGTNPPAILSAHPVK